MPDRMPSDHPPSAADDGVPAALPDHPVTVTARVAGVEDQRLRQPMHARSHVDGQVGGHAGHTAAYEVAGPLKRTHRPPPRTRCAVRAVRRHVYIAVAVPLRARGGGRSTDERDTSRNHYRDGKPNSARPQPDPHHASVVVSGSVRAREAGSQTESDPNKDPIDEVDLTGSMHCELTVGAKHRMSQDFLSTRRYVANPVGSSEEAV